MVRSLALSHLHELYPLTVSEVWSSTRQWKGLTILHDAIMVELAITGNGHRFGWSQSALIASLEIPEVHGPHLRRNDLNFVLVGSEMNPNGGMLARFQICTTLDLTFLWRSALGHDLSDGHLHARSTTGSPTSRDTRSASFPRAVAGVTFIHQVLDLTPAQVEALLTAHERTKTRCA